MPLEFNLQRAERCLLVHLKAPKDFIFGEGRPGRDMISACAMPSNGDRVSSVDEEEGGAG
jgi:hypothetical protein